MEPPSLKLRIEKGPRHGETLDCNPGSNIRIGRFVRGNTFVIKNAAISSKHLLIEFCNSSWVLQDLDSSNGTFLNGTQLKPFTPTPLHDADIVKIGDTTSILVNVVPAGAPDSVSDSDVVENDPQPSLLRRNPRRRAKEKVSAPAVNPRTGDKALNEENLEAGIGNLGLESEIGDVGAEKKAGGKRRGRPPRKGRVLKDVHEEVEEKAPPRRTSARRMRGVKTQQQLVEDVQEDERVSEVQMSEEVEEKAPPRQTSARRMRGAKTQQQLAEDVQEDERVSEVRMGEQVEKKAAPATRRMRGAKNQQQLVEDAQEEEGGYEVQKGEVGVSGDNVEGKEVPPRMSTRCRRNKQQTIRDVLENSSLNQDAGQETGNVVLVEGSKMPAGSRRRKNAKDNPSEDVKINNENEKNNDEVIAEKSNMEQEARKESESSSGPKESGSRAEEALAPDLEKMTLGEWLDYLEMALPRQIRAETERVIEGMKRRAQEVSEYVEMKKNEKGKQPMTWTQLLFSSR